MAPLPRTRSWMRCAPVALSWTLVFRQTLHACNRQESSAANNPRQRAGQQYDFTLFNPWLAKSNRGCVFQSILDDNVVANRVTEMTRTAVRATSRRDFLKVAAGAAAFGPFFLFPDRALATQKTLKIAKWAHFLPEFDQWFVNVLAKEWGLKNDTKVTVDVIPLEEVHTRAKAEVKAGKGHDVFMFPWPPSEFYQHVIDHGEIYQTLAGKYGQIDRL